MPARLAFLMALSLASWACADSAATGTAVWQTLVDTLGDTIVVRTIGADSPPRHGIATEMRIGELEGAEEYTFGTITDLVVTPEGDFYVFDAQATQLRRYDSTGTFVRNVGRRGAGPGEYGHVNGVDVGSDGRVYIWDAENTRVSIYTEHDEIDQSFRVLSGLHTSDALAVDSTGRAFTLTLTFGPDVTKWRPIVVRFGAGGLPVDTIEVPAYDLPAAAIVAQPPGGPTASRMVPYFPLRQFAYMPDMQFVSGRSDVYVLHRQRPDGGVLRIERDAPAVPVSAAERSEQEALATHVMRDVDPSWRWNGPPIPEVKPYFKALRSGMDGRIWAQLSQPGELDPEADTVQRNPDARPPIRYREPQVWDVFEADGRYLGQVELPFGFTLHVMRGEHVWGVLRDELDVQSVVRARIDPPFAPRSSETRASR